MEGTPPVGYETFGTYTDVGVTNLDSVSAPNSAYIAVDFSEGGWGVGLTRFPGPAMDLTGATLSVDILSLQNISGYLPMVALRIADGDGVIYRSPNSSLFLPTTEFSTFSQDVSTFIYDGEGPPQAIDLTDIISVGFLFYNHVEDLQTVFYMDNFQGGVIPEASHAALLLGLAFLCLAVARRHCRKSQ